MYYQFINRTTWLGNETDPHHQLIDYERVYRYWVVRSSEFTKTGMWINENVEEPWKSRVLALDMGFDNYIDDEEVNKTEYERTLCFTGGTITEHFNSTTLTNSNNFIFTMEVNETMALNWGLHRIGIPIGEATTLTWDPSKIPTDISLTLDGTDMKLHNSMELGEGSHLFVISGSTGEPIGGFDTDSPANPYPSISGTHNGTIKPNVTVEVSKLYTYPCVGTGGHTEYARIWNNSGLDVNASWNGYVDDWYNISFFEPFTLLPNETYNYTICTGSYPQIHHTPALLTASGWINSTEFTDANGRRYDDWIPVIKLE